MKASMRMYFVRMRLGIREEKLLKKTRVMTGEKDKNKDRDKEKEIKRKYKIQRQGKGQGQ